MKILETKICGIYKITSPKGKIYIGQSKNIKKRWYSYVNLYCKSQPKIYNSLKKYGVSSHKFEVIHICNLNELDELELFYIDFYQSFKNNIGLNCSRTTEDKIHIYKLEYNEKRKKHQQKKIKSEIQKRYSKKKESKREKILLDKNNLKGLTDLLAYDPLINSIFDYCPFKNEPQELIVLPF